MAIWQRTTSLEDINSKNAKLLAGDMGIRISEIGEDYLKAELVVQKKACQAYGILHGGASVVMAETVGSEASFLALDEDHACVGQEISANHLRPARVGEILTAIATPVHLGKSSHVWDIRISNAEAKLTCVSRLTLAIMPYSRFK